MAGFFEDLHRKVGNVVGDDTNIILDPIGGELQMKSDNDAALAKMQSQINNMQPAAPTDAQTLLNPTAMPTSSDLKVAQRKAAALQLSRKGRSSTILTGDDALGAAG